MKILLLLLTLASCSHRNKDAELSSSSKDLPDWIYAPYQVCQEAVDLCATGEAKTMGEADTQARANLASIFEVSIKSNFNAQTATSQSLPWLAKVNEEVRQSIEQSVSQVLENVQIKNHFKKDGLSYSLASLDRSHASELLSPRLTKLDKEIEVLWVNRSRTSLRRMVKLNLEREKLNQRYAIINGTGRPPKVTFEQIISWKESRPATVPLMLKVGQSPEWLTDKLTELLTEAGFRLVKSESSRVVSLNVETIKEYMNVSGFEKFTFTLNLVSFKNGEKNKVISTSETVNGRTQADALLKVKHFFTEYLEQHLSDLHID